MEDLQTTMNKNGSFFFFCKNQNTDLKKNSQNCKTENPNAIID